MREATKFNLWGIGFSVGAAGLIAVAAISEWPDNLLIGICAAASIMGGQLGFSSAKSVKRLDGLIERAEKVVEGLREELKRGSSE